MLHAAVAIGTARRVVVVFPRNGGYTAGSRADVGANSPVASAGVLGVVEPQVDGCSQTQHLAENDTIGEQAGGVEHLEALCRSRGRYACRISSYEVRAV